MTSIIKAEDLSTEDLFKTDEHKLLCGILARCIRDIVDPVNCGNGDTPKVGLERELRQSAVGWIFTDDEGGYFTGFTCIEVCNYLGIDLGLLRNAVNDFMEDINWTTSTHKPNRKLSKKLSLRALCSRGKL